MRWLVACGVVVFTFVLAPILGKLVRRLGSRPATSERVQALRDPAANFVSTMVITCGLIVAIGVLSPDTLAPFPTKIIEFVPRLLVAILLILLGSTFAGLAANIVGMTALQATGRPQTGLTRLIRSGVMMLVSLLAVSQLGVNTRILDTLTQAVLFSVAAALALLAVVGGRDLASQLSTGRYIRRIVKPGDRIESDAAGGVVLAVHAATIEVHVDDRTTLHVPHSLLMASPLQVTAAADPQPTTPTGTRENQ